MAAAHDDGGSGGDGHGGSDDGRGVAGDGHGDGRDAQVAQEVAGVWIKQAMFSQGESSISSSSSVLLQIISLVKALMEGPPTAAIMAVSSNFSRCIRPQRRK